MKGRNGKEGKIAQTDNCFFISHRIFIFNIPAEIELYFCPAEIAEIAERGYAPCHADSKQVIQKD
jgi:hypothetical protein